MFPQKLSQGKNSFHSNASGLLFGGWGSPHMRYLSLSVRLHNKLKVKYAGARDAGARDFQKCDMFY